MDYKYIEQLLERYWACETSVEEEQILRAFFRQKEVPAHLLPYKSLFAYEDAAADLHLGEDFDERILSQVERPSVKARRLPMRRRMMPLFKAAAVVAVMLSLGTIAQHSFDRSRQTDYNYDAYQDTYTDPQSAYGTVSEALQIVSESFQKSQVHDSDSVADTAPKQAVQ